MRFLIQKIVNRQIKSKVKEKRKLDEFDLLKIDEKNEIKIFKFQIIRDYKIVILNLYHYQHSRDLNHHSSLNEIAFQSLFKIQRAQQHETIKRHHENRDKKIIANDYDIFELQRITKSF